jgi:hypothetical protein
MDQPAQQQLVIGRARQVDEIDAALTTDAADRPSVVPEDAHSEIADAPSLRTSRRNGAGPNNLDIAGHQRAQLGFERFLIELRPDRQHRRPPAVVRQMRRKLPRAV